LISAFFLKRFAGFLRAGGKAQFGLVTNSMGNFDNICRISAIFPGFRSQK
jgi:hypothetical protein